MNKRFLTAEWRKLAIANYAVDPAILLPYLPYRTELDTWNDQHYVSLVGFRFINTRLRGIGIPFHKHFEEVNLRFYVRFKEAGEWRRGVTFIREIVPRRALTWVANTIYKENYITLPMKHRWHFQEDFLDISYSWKFRNRWNDFSLRALPSPQEIAPDSAEEFITEHYWGYTPLRADRSSEYGVEHPRWQHYEVADYKIDVAFEELYDPAFRFLNDRRPDSVMLAEGSEIVVNSMRKLR